MKHGTVVVWALLGLAACSSGTVGDAGSEDAAALRDTGARDAGAPADGAEPSDAAEVPDGSDASDPGMDAGSMDAVGADVLPPDADPCGPIDREFACSELGRVIGAHAARCYPELSANEAGEIGNAFCERIRPVIDDPAVGFDAAAFGACACDLANVACDVLSPLETLASCAAVITGTIAVGNPCEMDHRCVPGAYCQPLFTPTVVAGGITSCEGNCREYVAPGQPCRDETTFQLLRCTSGYTCSEWDEEPTCQPKVPLGADCSTTECLGSSEGLIFPLAQCVISSTTATCQAYGRAGASCAEAACNTLYACEGGQCVLRPGENDPCELPVDVPAPDRDQTLENLQSAPFACRVTYLEGYPGLGCVQTGTTSGAGTCLALPRLGEACGIGPGLSALCVDSVCAAIDSSTLAPITSVCVPQALEGEGCEPLWPAGALGEQCAPGLACYGKGIGACYPVSFCR